MDEVELKQDLKLQEEEEKPTVSKKEGDNAFRNLLRQEIRNAIKDMLVDNEPLMEPMPKKKDPEDKIADKLVIEKDLSHEKIIPYQESADASPPTIQIESYPEDGPPPSASPSAPSPEQPPTASIPKRQPTNEWDEYEKQKGMADYIDSEWSHRSYLLSTKFVDTEVFMLHDLVLKELSLSNLPDTEIAFIYAVKMDCIEEWMSMGFYDLAKQRLVHMLFRLRLMTSVEGLELIAQHGTSAISMSMDRLQPEREGMDEEGDQNKKKSLGIRNVLNKLKR